MIKIICVGKIKESFYRDAMKEYQKRLSKYSKLEIVEVNDFALTPQLNREREGEKILENINIKDFVITLEIEGRSLDSIELSNMIDKWSMNYCNLCFVIGGSDGLSDKIKERSNYALSFSKFTFPHQLFRIMLLEQIYRAYRIINNESYHK